MKLTNLLLPALLAASLLPGAAQAARYAVAIDTHAVAGTAGSIDFQWNLGAGSPALPASISSFASGGGVLAGDPVLLSGGAGGSLATGARLDFSGTDAFTYAYQNLAFGNAIRFVLDLPDAFPAQPDPSFASVFSVALFDAALNPALPTTSPDALALRWDFEPGRGAATVTAFTAPGVATVTAVPEPAAWALLAAGLGLVALRNRRRTV